MHPACLISDVLRLAEEGHTATEVAPRTGLPRSTVRDWLQGVLPRSAKGPAEGGCRRCNAGAHEFSVLPAEYMYALGLYLGDGCISAHRRGVYKLRFFLDARYSGIIDECEDAIRKLRPENKVSRRLRSGGYANSSEARTSRSPPTRARGHASSLSTARDESTSVPSSSLTGSASSWSVTQKPCSAG
jgi:hypothetical protein